MTSRTITIFCICLLLVSCRWKTDQHKPVEEKESPVITSLNESGLPCFKCHAYEKFSSGAFPHQKHLGLAVHCNQCHVIKPHNEMKINKTICDGCHKLSAISYTNTPLTVVFSHQNHLKKLHCGDCHTKLFQMKKGSSRITMADMYKGDSCGRCHNGKTAFSSKECSKCHNMSALAKNFIYKSGDMAPAVFSHQVHMAMFGCESCHTSIFKFKKGGAGMKMEDLYQGKFCGSCHNGKTAFSSSECQLCHK